MLTVDRTNKFLDLFWKHLSVKIVYDMLLARKDMYLDSAFYSMMEHASHYIMRDATIWIQYQCQHLPAFLPSLASPLIQDEYQYKVEASKDMDFVFYLRMAGPFVDCKRPVVAQMYYTTCLIELSLYQPHMITEQFDTLATDDLKFYNSPISEWDDESRPYTISSLVSHPLFFSRFAVETKLIVETLHRYKNHIQELKFNECLLLLRSTLEYPELLTMTKSMLSIILLGIAKGSAHTWAKLYCMNLLCEWWERKWLLFESHDEWQMLFKFLYQYGIGTPPRIVNMLANMAQYCSSSKFELVSNNIRRWLSSVSTFVLVPQNIFCDVLFS